MNEAEVEEVKRIIDEEKTQALAVLLLLLVFFVLLAAGFVAGWLVGKFL